MSGNKTISSERERELRALFRKTNKKTIILLFLGLIFFAISVWVAVKISPGLGGIVFGILEGPLSFVVVWHLSDLKDNLAEDIIPMVLKDYFEDVEYDSLGHIDKSVIKNTDMAFPFSKENINEIIGSDLISGTRNGVPFRMSDIAMYHKYKSNNKSCDETLFCGQWITCSFKKKLSCDIIISENLKDDKYNKERKKQRVKTDSDVFNDKYSVYSESAEEAFYLLTPHMMEFIISMDKSADALTYLHFSKNGTLHIAMDSSDNLFELSGALIQNYEKSVSGINYNAKYLAGLIDEIKQIIK